MYIIQSRIVMTTYCFPPMPRSVFRWTSENDRDSLPLAAEVSLSLRASCGIGVSLVGMGDVVVSEEGGGGVEEEERFPSGGGADVCTRPAGTRTGSGVNDGAV